MSEPVRAPVATLDWLPPRVALRQHVVAAAVRVFERAGFGQVVTPTFEETALFSRTAGDASDIVSKEMYSFRDKGDRELTLRPEGTAPVVRAYLEHGLAREPQPVKLWYFAPMFRYAKGQRGRYREHWQFGVESLGSDDPAVDAEVIALQAAWYGELGLLDGLELELNSIGDSACRPAYRELLVAYLERFRGELSADSRARLDDQPAAHLRLQGRGRPQDRAGRAAHHRSPLRRLRRALRGRARVPRRARRRATRHARARARHRLLRAHRVGVGRPGGGAQAGLDLGRRALRRPRRADRRQARAGRRLRLRHRARRARARGGRRRAGRPRRGLVLRLRRPRRAAGAARARRGARARGLASQADLAGRSLKGQLRHAERLRARVVTVCRAGDGERGIVRHGETEIAFGDVVDYVERSVRERVSAYRDMLCGEPRAEHAGRELTLSGWVGGRRDHGGLVFIDLRDRTGIVQLVMDPDRSPEAHATAQALRLECVVRARGKLVPRSEATRNDQLPTGAVELAVESLELLSSSEVLPFQLDDENVDEGLRIRHRYLDLRRPRMQDLQGIRTRAVRSIRRFLDERGFLDIETPTMTRATPEGAATS